MLCFGIFRLDPRSRRLWSEDREVLLAPKAFELLNYLAAHAGEVLSRTHLLDALWPGTYVDDHALSVQIRDLRKALNDDVKSPKYIETRHRLGYCFKMAVSRAACANSFETETTSIPFNPPAPPPAVPETRYARSHDADIAYQVFGEGPIDLIFVMGWVSHLEYFWTEPSFARFLRRLATFSRVILFDKRGTGLSDRVPISGLPTLEQRMFDLRAVMDAAQSSKAALVGVSEGGPMSAVFAATYPERTHALVMIGTYAKRIRSSNYPWGPTSEQREAFLREIQDNWGGPVGLEERAPSLANDARFRDWWSAYLRMGASPGAAMAITRMNSEIDVRHVLPTVRVPTLVLHRSHDRCLHVEEGRYVASLIRGSEFVELPGEDHLPFVGDQDRILDEVERFLSSAGSSPDHNTVLATVLALDYEGAGDAIAKWLERVHSGVRWFRGENLCIDSATLTATFDGPARAVRCACELMAGAVRFNVQTRAATHTGECEIVQGLPAGGAAVAVVLAILRQANCGEMLASKTVQDLVAGSGLRFESIPNRRVNAGERTWSLFSVNVE